MLAVLQWSMTGLFALTSPAVLSREAVAAADAAQNRVIAPDRGLEQRFREDDLFAYQQLVQKWQNPVHRVISRLLGGHDSSAEDLAQEIFVKAYLKRKEFRVGSTFGTWIYRIAVNQCIDELRRRKRHPLQSWEELESNRQEQAVGLVQYSEPSSSSGKSQVVQKALASLAEPFRVVLVLKEIEGLPIEEIARILNVREGTVKSRLFRAREAMRKALPASLEDI